jgi:hypothetical protein
MLIAPPQLALVTARIPRFDALAPADQLRAAALALRRDFNIDDAQLKLAARSISSSDDRVLIAYTTRSSSADAVDARWFEAAQTDTIYWLGAPNGFVLSNAGAAPIEHWSPSDGIPAPIMSIVAQRARAEGADKTHVIIDDVTAAHIDDATLALWRASLGATIDRGHLPGAARAMALLAPPTATAEPAKSSLDRALLVAACVAALCAVVSIVRYASIAAPQVANGAATNAPGEVWARATAAAPALAERAKQATYGGGAWVITAPTLERNALPAIAQSLSTNGLAAQTVTEPEARVRVQKP